ncbi:hypothetical protein FQV27_06270 [Paracoccus aurantiacus]|uniref:PepSY domain-containing protein n=1 Tax=Paracoccus aurantiacus TaxID=2599412 RepID=A0A5C6S5L6_9RHOB|nr:hypothetical protein [Paracoccus aurantiacus]TXB69723.1 hypothetical protein FQV27_06270 [Paracoccus aurantiacus]
MRPRLAGMMFCALATAAQADVPIERVRAQFAAQGYENIQIVQDNGTFRVTATRGRLMIESAIDIKTGDVISERMRQITDEPEAEPSAGEGAETAETAETPVKSAASAASGAETTAESAPEVTGDNEKPR